MPNHTVSDVGSPFRPELQQPPTDAAERGSGRPALPALTGLRFWAAFHVMLFHLSTPSSGVLGRIIAFGPASVGLFFVLSGFILAYTYLKKEPVPKKRFWRARFARVYPVYLIGVLIPLTERWFRAGGRLAMPSTWWPAIKMTVATVGVKTTAAALLLVQSWHPDTACQLNCVGWSLSAEAFFYLIFPFLAGLVWARSVRSSLSLVLTAWSFAVAAAALYFGIDRGLGHLLHPPRAFDVETVARIFAYWPLLHLPEFIIGMAAGRIFIAQHGRTDWSPGQHVVIGGATVAAILGCYAISPPSLRGTFMNGVFAPLYALLIYSLAQRGNPLTAIVGGTLAVALGEMSYALYVLHPAIVEQYAALSARGFVPGPDTPAGFMAVCAVILAIAYGVFHVIEEPARRALRAPTDQPLGSRIAVR